MDWDGVRLFLALARGKRLSGAARQLGVEHTTVGRRLAALEKEIGAPLFHRTVAGYRLTAAGESILAAAETMERAANTLESQAQHAAERVAGDVRVALNPEFASHWLMPHLHEFHQRHPKIKLHILVATRQRDISRGEAELAVQSPRPKQVGLVASRIGRAVAALYASKGFLRGRSLSIRSAADVGSMPLLTYIRGLDMLQRVTWFQSLLPTANVLLETNSTHALAEGARRGLGIAVLPRVVARTDPSLVEVSPPVAELDVWLITHPELRRDPKVRATAEFLRKIAADLA
jgi:DNA-binding transcriptional LysR family regulator